MEGHPTGGGRAETHDCDRLCQLFSGSSSHEAVGSLAARNFILAPPAPACMYVLRELAA